MARDHPVPTLVSRAIRIFPHAPPLPIAHVARARRKIRMARETIPRHVSANQNYAWPRAAARGLALIYVHIPGAAPAL